MKNNAYVLKLGLLALALFLMVTGVPTAQAGGFNVDSLVTFTPLSSTYRTTTNTTGCPAGYAGKFTFTAQLTNKSDSPAMPGLDVLVQTLTNGNVLLDPQTNTVLGGEGAVMEVPQVGQYADGLLSPDESVQVPFVVCLKTLPAVSVFRRCVRHRDRVGEYQPVWNEQRQRATRWHQRITSPDSVRMAASWRLRAAASDLVANDTNGTVGRVRARYADGNHHAGERQPAGTDSGNGNVFTRPMISADGRFVAFTSGRATWWRTTPMGRRRIRARSADGNHHASQCQPVRNQQWQWLGGTSPALSADGHFVAFRSLASDLVRNRH